MKRMIPLVTFFLMIDLITKRWIDSVLTINERIEVIDGILGFQLYYNSGATMGLLEGYTGLLLFLQTGIILLLIYGYIRATPKRFAMQVAFSLLISGGIGNLVDRIQYGHVIDFLSVKWSSGIFNVADMFIRYGFILIVILYFMKKFTIQGLDEDTNQELQKSERG
ncbi:signal peptidase II [Bacillus sp. N1-1]|nr:signal peptidase II [Bacillus sp. N1-1]